MKNPVEIDSLYAALKQGDRKALSRAITIVENDIDGADVLLKQLQPNEVPVVGFTGPPGAGKSTLINALLRRIVALGKKAAVIAVDPTSPFNFGSLLADRIRMSEHFNNENVFIRSLATRGSLGGLTEKIIEVTDVLRAAGFDFIIVETVGVGQSEVEIAGLADTTVVVVVPESGDDVQTLKSGIMEIADIFVVNKSDREGAALLSGNLKKMLEFRGETDWPVPVINTIASEGNGIEELVDSIARHRASKKFNSKKTFLLTEKAYRLIQNHRMAGLKKDEVRQKVEDAMKDKSFNLYRLVDQMKA